MTIFFLNSQKCLCWICQPFFLSPNGENLSQKKNPAPNNTQIHHIWINAQTQQYDVGSTQAY
jgi:hypothetical protein